MDKKGRVFASWISGTFICGTGECLYVASNGFDSVYEQETELVVDNGSVYLDDAKCMISQNIDLSKIKAPKGRVTLNVFSSRMYVPHNTKLNGSVISAWIRIRRVLRV